MLRAGVGAELWNERESQKVEGALGTQARRLLPRRLLDDRLVKVLERLEVAVAQERELVDEEEEVSVVCVEVGCS